MAPISLRAEAVFHIGAFPVTNALLLSLLVLVVLITIGILLRRRLKFVPGNGQGLVELLLEGVLGLMDSVLGDRRKSEKYLPLVLTIFLFVLISNWMGLLPGIGSFVIQRGGETAPLLRSPSSDLNFTLALALIAVTAINILGGAAIGFKKRASVFINLKGPVHFFVGLLELLSEFAKIVSFSFRLFGNVFAGEVLLGIMAFLIPYFLPLPFMLLEMFTGFIQAFIFGMLTLVFISMAVTHEEEEEHTIENGVLA